MTDVVVTVPMGLWADWLVEGDAVGEAREEGVEYGFNLYQMPIPTIRPGERVYIVAHGKLRGYAPLTSIDQRSTRSGGTGRGYALVRRGDAVAVTITEAIRGFRGWRYKWWLPSDERPFPEWRLP